MMNDKQMLYLLWVTILNQSQKAEEIIKNTKNLMERLGLIENLDENFKKLTYTKIETAMLQPTKLHRFPKNMSKYLYSSVVKMREEKINIGEIFEGNNKEIKEKLYQFQGIGKHKIEVVMKILDIYTNQIKKNPFIGINCPRLDETVWKELEILNELGKENKKEIGEER